MKLIIVIMTTFLLQVSAAGYGQRITIVRKNISLSEVFKEIRKQSGYNVLWNTSEVNVSVSLNLNLRNQPLEAALEQVLAGKELSYTIKDETVMIKAKEKSYLETVIARFQSIDVRGKVVDSFGNGLAGATVSVKGGKQTTSSAANGDFMLKNVDEEARIIVSYLGYVTKEQEVNKDFVYVQLKQSESKLDEVQIMGYGKTSRRLNTGNITTIKGEDIEKQIVDNPLSALMGRIPNLQITPGSGLPGSSMKIQLRGQNSLGSNTGITRESEPLIIIDGIPFTNNISGAPNFIDYGSVSALSFINPNDIESIDVLADADASSIYGSRGGSGVILITTKKGQSGSTSINVSSRLGISEVSKKLDLLNTQEYLELRREAFRNDGVEPQVSNQFENSYAPDLLLWDQQRYTDWQDEMLGNKALNYNTLASISGGGADVKYLFSGTYNKQGYVFSEESKDEKGSGHFSITGNSKNQKFHVSFTGHYTFNSRLTPSQDFTKYAVSLPPNAPDPYVETGVLNWQANPNLLVSSSTWSNPYAELLRTLEAKTKAFNVSSDVGYNFTNGLDLKIVTGFNDVSYKSLYINPIASFDPTIDADSRRGSAYRYLTQSGSWSFEPQIRYNKSIGYNKIDAIFGGSLQSQMSLSEVLFANGYTNDALLKNLSAAQSIYGQPAHSSTNTSNEYRYSALFSRINYNFKETYIVNLSARRDGSSRFGPNRQFGNFWSVGAAWLFSNEPIVKHLIPFLSFGKVRGSYGSTGNDAIGDYQYLELYQPYFPDNFPVNYQGLTPLLSNGAVNPYYSWENINKAELALDFGLLKDRILFSTSYWTTISSNQLGRVVLPATAGGAEITSNLHAKIQNAGWDITFNLAPFLTKSFSWSISGNIGWLRNKLISLPDESYRMQFGLPYRSDVNPEGLPFANVIRLSTLTGVNPVSGYYQFLDDSGSSSSYLINPDFYKNVVSVAPKYSGGISNKIRFHRVTLDFFFQFIKQLGRNPFHDFVFANPGSLGYEGTSGNLPKEYLNRWHEPGDVSYFQKVSIGNARKPTPASQLGGGYLWMSNRNYVDASFIRLQNLQLSYDLPSNFVTKFGLKTCNLSLQAQNVLTFSKYRGLDPQIQSVGSLPLLRSIVMGVQINF